MTQIPHPPKKITEARRGIEKKEEAPATTANGRMAVEEWEPRVSGSRSDWRNDDGASCGRAIFNNLGLLSAHHTKASQVQDC